MKNSTKLIYKARHVYQTQNEYMIDHGFYPLLAKVYKYLRYIYYYIEFI